MKLSFVSALLILFCILLNVSAQLGLKVGVLRSGVSLLNWGNISRISLQVITNPIILLALFFYVLSLIVWILVLARVDVSIAYPLSALGYIINALAAYYILHEDLNPMKIFGILVILLGVFMVARS